MMQNTLFLCGLEYDFYEYMGLDDYPFVRGMADDERMIVAPSRSAARQMLIKEYSLEEYIHPMTIRKVCITTLEPGILEWEEYEILGKLARDIVPDLVIPYAGWCIVQFDERSEDRSKKSSGE